jgi:hypothetical protein
MAKEYRILLWQTLKKKSHLKAEKEIGNKTELILKKNVFTNWTEMAADLV